MENAGAMTESSGCPMPGSRRSLRLRLGRGADASRRREGVIRELTLDEVVALFTSTPEQPVYDWKGTFRPPRRDEVAKGEFVKDVMAVANGTRILPIRRLRAVRRQPERSRSVRRR